MTCPIDDQPPTTMRATTSSPFGLAFCPLLVAALMATSATIALAQQPPLPRPAQVPTHSDAQTAPPAPIPLGQSQRALLPQGFSVVLVLGDIQGATGADDVPPAARKALTDMRDFLPFKSYKLLDAAWVMCCGQNPRPPAQTRNLTSTFAAREVVTQMLRGPDDQEYELNLSTSRAENSQVFVRFSLLGSTAPAEVAVESTSGAARAAARRIGNLRDQRALIEKQIVDTKKRVDVGVAPASEVAKLELELRRVEREALEVEVQMAESRAGQASGRATQHPSRSNIIDTSFTMDVGETVVVGTSRLKGGSRALIALLTAVPPRTASEKRE